MTDSHDEIIRDEFSRQSEGFNAAPLMSGSAALGALIEIAPFSPGECWLETASGPGIVSRALAPHVESVHGVDLTETMVVLARREAAAEGFDNVTFEVGDTTRLQLGDGEFDGAINRFSLHHIPRPERVFAEMARVVRPGGAVVIADIVAEPDHDAAAWREEVERLRDPSHWAFVSVNRLRSAGEAAGLRLEAERIFDFEIDYVDWLDRGSAGPERAALIEAALEDVPATATMSHVDDAGGRRRLFFRQWLSVWRKPTG